MTAQEALLRESPLARWARRAVTLPGALLAAAVALAVVPALLPAALLVDLLRRRPLPLARTLLLGLWWLLCEALGVAAALALGLVRPLAARDRWLRWNGRLQLAWCRALLAGLRGLFRASLEVEGLEAVGRGPLLVLARHTSAADTLLPVALLGGRCGLRLRYVLKRGLLWDPCLDLVGQRLPNAFVARGAEGAGADVAAVRALGAGLAADEGVLIYPEGTRFTPAKRAAALERLAASRWAAHAAGAAALRRVLPPRPGGVLALLEAAPSADVLLLGHVGLEGTAAFGDLLAGRLVGARLRVRVWRVDRQTIPAGPEERVAWLHEQWARLDAWVEAASS